MSETLDMGWIPINEHADVPVEFRSAENRLHSVLAQTSKSFQLYRGGGTIAAVGPFSALLNVGKDCTVPPRLHSSIVVLFSGETPSSPEASNLSEIATTMRVVGALENDLSDAWGEVVGSITASVTIQLRSLESSPDLKRRLTYGAPRKVPETDENLPGRGKWFKKRH